MRQLGTEKVRSISGELAELLLSWAANLVYDRPVRKFDPEMPTSAEFLPSLGRPPDPTRKARWSSERLLRARARYADAVNVTTDEFRRELEEVLDERATAFGREFDRLSAFRCRQETWRTRDAADALLPPLDVLERVSKYEKHLHNMLTSTLHELERLQARRGGAELLFQVFADRYERRSVQVTSNLAFSEWGTVFQGDRMTATLLDRLTHRCDIFEMSGESYRFRESMRAKKDKDPQKGK